MGEVGIVGGKNRHQHFLMDPYAMTSWVTKAGVTFCLSIEKTCFTNSLFSFIQYNTI